MRKQLVEFKAVNEYETATLQVSAVCLSPAEHTGILAELEKISGICFTFIDADTIQAVISGDYDSVYDTTRKLMENEWSFTDDDSDVNV